MASYSYVTNEEEEIDESEENEMILFQCKSCNAVLANSSHSEGANSDLGLIVLRELPETIAQVDRTEDDGEEEDGCDFSLLCCAECDAVVGKFYRTTTKELSVLKNRGTLEFVQLKFHTLDASKFRPTPSPPVAPPPAPAEVVPANQLSAIQEALTKLSGDVAKIQYVMCNFDERIQRMEKLMGLSAIEHQESGTTADVSVRSGNATLDSSVSQRSTTSLLTPSSQGRADMSGRNVSVPNGHHDRSSRSDTFMLNSSVSHSWKDERSDFGRKWNSDGSIVQDRHVSPAAKQSDTSRNGSFPRKKRSFEPGTYSPSRGKPPGWDDGSITLDRSVSTAAKQMDTGRDGSFPRKKRSFEPGTYSPSRGKPPGWDDGSITLDRSVSTAAKQMDTGRDGSFPRKKRSFEPGTYSPGRGKPPGRDVSVTNGNLEQSAKSGTFVLSSSMSQNRKGDFLLEREPDRYDDRVAQRRKPQKRQNTDSTDRSTAGKKQRNSSRE